ncbi:MAG: hypothetical protein AAGA65_25060 [Actinomycetota bacterium]
MLACGLAVLGAAAVAGCGVPAADSSAAIPPHAAVAEDGDGPDSLVVDGGDSPEIAVRPEVEIPTAWDSQIEALFGRYWLYWEAFAAAYGPPNADPEFGPLRDLSTPDNWDSLQQQLQGFVEDGLVLVLPDRSVTEHLIRLPDTAVLDSAEGAEVVLQDCWIDDFIQQTVAGEVIAETGEAKLMNVTMMMLDGDWRVAGVTRAAPDADGYDQCQELSP